MIYQVTVRTQLGERRGRVELQRAQSALTGGAVLPGKGNAPAGHCGRPGPLPAGGHHSDAAAYLRLHGGSSSRNGMFRIGGVCKI